jgi:hypothetical protein
LFIEILLGPNLAISNEILFDNFILVPELFSESELELLDHIGAFLPAHGILPELHDRLFNSALIGPFEHADVELFPSFADKTFKFLLVHPQAYFFNSLALVLADVAPGILDVWNRPSVDGLGVSRA